MARVVLPRLEHDDLDGAGASTSALNACGVGLDRREGVVVAGDHLPGADRARAASTASWRSIV